MTGQVESTEVRISLSMTHREAHLLQQLCGHTTGFEGERISQVPESASDFTALMHGLSALLRQSLKAVKVETFPGERGLNPEVTP